MPTILEFDGVSYTYPDVSARALNLKNKVLRSSFRKVSKLADQNDPLCPAINNLSLTISHGSRLALFGSNGAGKTTLLRLASRQLIPTGGSIRNSLITLSLLGDRTSGLDHELTGYENCHLLLRTYGLWGRSLTQAIDSSLDLFGFPERVNHLVNTYSAGMQVRLRTSTLLHCPGEILLLDELLGLADADFRQRVEPLLMAKIDASAALVLATHSRSVAEQFCDEGLWICGGKAIEKGPVRQVWDAYTASLKNH